MDCVLMQDLTGRLPSWVEACADLAVIAVSVCREIYAQGPGPPCHRLRGGELAGDTTDERGPTRFRLSDSRGRLRRRRAR